MKGNQQQQPSAGKTLVFGPQATNENGVLQRQLQEDPLAPKGQSGLAGLLSSLQQSPGMQAAANVTPSGGGMGIPSTSQDPALAATMQGLEGLLGASKQKKQDAARMLMGGG